MLDFAMASHVMVRGPVEGSVHEWNRWNNLNANRYLSNINLQRLQHGRIQCDANANPLTTPASLGLP